MEGLARIRVSGVEGKTVAEVLNVWEACNIQMLWLFAANLLKW